MALAKNLWQSIVRPGYRKIILTIRQSFSRNNVQFSLRYARVNSRLSGILLLSATLDKHLNLYIISEDDFQH